MGSPLGKVLGGSATIVLYMGVAHWVRRTGAVINGFVTLLLGGPGAT